jgi:hypothetical protein
MILAFQMRFRNLRRSHLDANTNIFEFSSLQRFCGFSGVIPVLRNPALK